MYLFAVPWLPETLLRMRDYHWIQACFKGPAGLMNAPSGASNFIECYKNAIAQPGALTAAINFYRYACHCCGDCSPQRPAYRSVCNGSLSRRLLA